MDHRRFRRLRRPPQVANLERFERMRAVDVDDGVELIGDYGIEVVTLPLVLRPIDDADRPFQALDRWYVLLQEEESFDARLIERLLEASP